jgi:hypothetical protein
MIRLLEPSFESCPIKRLVVAKQNIGIPARREISAVLRLNSSLRIGISGPIKNIPARMFSDARKIGAPVRNLLFKIDLSRNLSS